jgi:D-galactarolactone cycloisomerase
LSGAPRIHSLKARVFRCPIETPVVTSFGVMRDRPMVLVRVEDADGAVGWGEAWCNFPTVGAEHRARLVESVLAPLAEGVPVASPAEAFRRLTEKTAVLALQSGEPGPLAQCIAGVDIALWDLAARRAGQPLWRMLGGTSPRVRVYASGLNPESPQALAAARQREGYRAFKLKVGFGIERDVANLAALRSALGEEAELMVDANQAWSLDEATAAVTKFEPFALSWLEEPLRADRPWSEWRALAKETAIPLAAGENLASEAAFEAALGSSALGVVQPDIAKWGGFSGGLPVAMNILAAGLRFCPHYLGGGIGLLASAHLLAAAGGDGALEVDANPNPLRMLTCGPLARVADGAAQLGDEPGLGATPDLAALERYRVL